MRRQGGHFELSAATRAHCDDVAVSDITSQPGRGGEVGSDEDEDAGAASQDERVTTTPTSTGECDTPPFCHLLVESSAGILKCVPVLRRFSLMVCERITA